MARKNHHGRSNGHTPNSSSNAASECPPGPEQESFTVVQDPRFSSIHRDPRFIPINKKKIKVKIDKRFKDKINADADFASVPPVYKMGRLRPKSTSQTLDRFYDMDSDSEHLSSSSSDPGVGKKVMNKRAGHFQAGLRGEAMSSKDFDDLSSSSSESSTFNDLESDADPESIDFGADLEVCPEHDQEGLFDEVLDRNNIPYGDATHRFAAVNMDWDHIKAADLYKVFDSLKPPRGTIVGVTIYPSQFGRERMEHESEFGPAIGEAHAVATDTPVSGDVISDDGDSDSDVAPPRLKRNLKTMETEENDADFDPVALRKYQLERLRYFYAIVECDSVDTAIVIFRAADGAEFEATSNFFDLRFVPSDVTFEEDEPARDVATPESIAAFRPIQFETRALQSSNVKLTWDQDDPDRTLITRKPVLYNKLKALDFKDYVASDSEGSDNDLNHDEISKYRALLGLDTESVNQKNHKPDNDDGDMEVTFTAGLHESAEKLMEEREERKRLENETTIEKYQRKQREKKLKKKQVRDGVDELEQSANELGNCDQEDLGFNDPFFSENIDLEKAEAMEKLEWAMNPKKIPVVNSGATSESVDKDVKGGKKKKRQSMRKQRQEEVLREEEEDGIAYFEMDATDSRFTSVLNESEYAIDPTNPHFRDTPGMSKLLKKKRRDAAQLAAPAADPESSVKSKAGGSDLVQLADAVKRKTQAIFSNTGSGLRAKRAKK